MAKQTRTSFNKSDLIQEICDQYKELTKARAKHIVNCIFDSISVALSNKQRVEIRGFGSFGLKQYEARMGKNPQTGESVKVKKKILPFFKVGKVKEDVFLD